ncbi:MAG: GDSL-type esterase/lipase family protein [Acidimicrobiia bacterium]|nr:GDSL-type esterase/lipase family protein [Acidimicrobiia bacterium]
MAKLSKSMLALPAAGFAFVATQVYRAGHRTDLPSHTNQETSGTFGHPGDTKLRMVAIGDSSITCPGVEDIDDCFVRRIAIHLSDRHFVELTSLAVGGSKARDVIGDQLEQAVALRPDLALVSVGANDALRATPVGAYEADLTTIVGAMHDVSGAVAVMGVGDLGTIPRLPRSLQPFLTFRARRIDDAAARVAEQFDRAAKTENWGRMSSAFASGDLDLWAGDQFHASGQGHAIFAEEALPAIEELLPYATGDRS